MNRTELSQALADATGNTPEFAASYRTAQNYLAFGQACRTLREARGLTQQALAERVGIDQGDISRIENGVWGKRGVSVATMERILAEFDYRLQFSMVPIQETLETEQPRMTNVLEEALDVPDRTRRIEITDQVTVSRVWSDLVQDDEPRYR
ncbi:MAG: helix-turn-helix transcriptional regulator [Proteobacteria bacterium]|nr:helix-turn-helix transcriptional regulator [Pseudomonadota bacterium]